jgi:ribokinase
MEQFDLVAVGSATLDLFLRIDPSNPHFKFNDDTKELSMHLGDKVVLDEAEFHGGGNANNVSVGVKRLGFKTALVAEVGTDEFGEKIINNLNKEGVDESLVIKGRESTSFSIILNFKNDRTIFIQKPEREHNFSFGDISTKWVYLTSLGEKWESTYQKVFDFVSQNAINLAFNPGTTQIDKGIGSISYILPKTDILILNKEEAESLIGKKDIKELLFELRNLGAKTVVITDGANGSYSVSDAREVINQKAEKAEVVSKTGAGDAYSSGFLGAILSGKSTRDAMKWGSINASSVLSKIGAQTGLLSSI